MHPATTLVHECVWILSRYDATYFMVHHFLHLGHCQQSMMGFTSLPLHLPINEPLPPLLPPCHTHVMLKHSNDATVIACDVIPTTETMVMGWLLWF